MTPLQYTFRVLGTALQLLGLAIAAHGVIKTRRQYGLPTMRATIGEWARGVAAAVNRAVKAAQAWFQLHVLRRRVPKKHTVSATVAITSDTRFGSPTVSQPIPALNTDEPVEGQVAALHAQLTAASARLDSVRNEQDDLRRGIAILEGTIEVKAGEVRDEANAQIRKQATDGLAAEASGLAITALGTLIAAFG